MITITERFVRQKPYRLEPSYVRYDVRELEPERFKPIGGNGLQVVRRRLAPHVAGLYGTNQSPRDRMRHWYRWDQREMRTERYQIIDSRWR